MMTPKEAAELYRTDRMTWKKFKDCQAAEAEQRRLAAAVSWTDHKPQFVHDCDTCTFLGTYNDHDLYFHQSTHPTIIARYSSNGMDYVSGMMFADRADTLAEAKRRAIVRGLLKN